MTWLSIILLALQGVLAVLNGIRSRRELQAGEDKAVAEAALSILKTTETGKRIMERIDAMSADERDDLTDDLGNASKR